MGAATKVIPLRLVAHPVAVAASLPGASSSPPYSTGEKIAIGTGVALAGTFLYLAFKK
jgi:hypothetical protein